MSTKKSITQLNKDVVADIGKMQKKLGYTPTLRQIGDAYGLTANGVSYHLKQAGVKRDKKGKFIIK